MSLNVSVWTEGISTFQGGCPLQVHQKGGPLKPTVVSIELGTKLSANPQTSAQVSFSTWLPMLINRSIRDSAWASCSPVSLVSRLLHVITEHRFDYGRSSSRWSFERHVCCHAAQSVVLCKARLLSSPADGRKMMGHLVRWWADTLHSRVLPGERPHRGGRGWRWEGHEGTCWSPSHWDACDVLTHTNAFQAAGPANRTSNWTESVMSPLPLWHPHTRAAPRARARVTDLWPPHRS